MKRDIYIPNPFGLSIEILEIAENHLPSFRCSFSICYNTISFSINYSSTDTWIDYSTFDDFLMNLHRLSRGEKVTAELADMSSEILYSVATEQISVEINRQYAHTSTGDIKLMSDCDNEIISMHIENIEKFAKWW